ncbi:hypothetical protein [Paremcibacter congregatus]|uniref:Uncharacterized protein n=1 Tax=Paremcibacter congregatus TaxID=2043170 RepID=A0A2G4YP96_9PROT|nr:hypothetical protein [Paremcibacter congregatus]PHZ84149.1 hypothetical protein CRD36_13205 [Paremcibacter congregatus]QDE25791.1 hypothetical protein FIV45_00105 [Paremcibacter congregatus]|tara:strand:- start:231 stop:428 length:198 start_codon:yes stop_codon:yes gene_type:complete
MANAITFIGCGVITLLLVMSIMLAGPHLLLPATFMIVVVLVGGLCVYIASGMIKRRAEIMKDWDA